MPQDKSQSKLQETKWGNLLGHITDGKLLKILEEKELWEKQKNKIDQRN